MARKYNKQNRFLRTGMSRKEREQRQFEAYKEAYHKQAITIKKILGYSKEEIYSRQNDEQVMRVPMIKDLEIFLHKHKQVKSKLKDDVKLGRRTSIGNVQQYMVRQSAYEITRKQEEPLLKYLEQNYEQELEEMGVKINKEGEFEWSRKNLLNLRRGELLKQLGVYDDMSSMYQNAKEGFMKEGLSKHEAVLKAKKIISNTFYYPQGK